MTSKRVLHDMKDNDFISLHNAFNRGDVERVQLVIDHNPNLLKHRKDSTKANILHVIADTCRDEDIARWKPIIKSIIKSLGVDEVARMREEKDSAGNTPNEYFGMNHNPLIQKTFYRVIDRLVYAEEHKDELAEAKEQRAREREASKKEAQMREREQQMQREAQIRLQELERQQQKEKQIQEARQYQLAVDKAHKNMDVSERKAAETHADDAKQFLNPDPLAIIKKDLDVLKAIAQELPKPRNAHEVEQIETMKRHLEIVMGAKLPLLQVKVNVKAIELGLSRIENSQLKFTAGEVMKDIMKAVLRKFPELATPAEEPAARRAGGPSSRRSGS